MAKDDTATITAKVTLDSELLGQFENHLRDGKAGSVEEDRGWFDAQLARVAKGQPDRTELADFLMMRAGFGGCEHCVYHDFN